MHPRQREIADRPPGKVHSGRIACPARFLSIFCFLVFSLLAISLPVAACPVVSGVSPSSGRLAGGDSVTITGTGFTGAWAVKFGATSATVYTVNSDTKITATSPAHAAGAVNITVTSAGGTSAISAADEFTYLAAPTITAISPSSGPLAGGDTVTITGTGFTTATAVKFGATSATGYIVDSDTKINATSPAGRRDG